MRSLYQFLATVFPGGYRFLSINFIAYICTREVSDYFSSSFLLVSLLATFSGMAVSTQSYVMGDKLSIIGRLYLTVLLLCLAALPCYWLWKGDLVGYLAVLVATYLYSIFEILRADAASVGMFKQLVICGVSSMVLLVPVSYFLQSSPLLLVVSVFLVLAVPVAVLSRGINVCRRINFYVIKDVCSYSLSNGLSTGVSFAMPLLLASEYGRGGATEIAQVFTLSALFMFYPRYLSAGFLVSYKKNRAWKGVIDFEKKVLCYVLLASSGYALVSDFLFPEYFKYFPLFVAVVFSQLALPCSNVMMVLGAGVKMLLVNILGFSVLVMVIGGIYYAIDVGEFRAERILWVYVCYVIIRAVALRMIAARIG